MCGVEGVAGVLEHPGVMAAIAPVEPDEGEGEQRQRLAGKENWLPEQRKFVAKAAQHLYMDVPQAENLANATPPFLLPEEIEHQHRRNPSDP